MSTERIENNGAARRWLDLLFPQQGRTGHGERVVSGLGAVVAIAVTAWVTHIHVGPVVTPFMIASMGASAVLLFGVPHSPLSQPWAFAGGHLVSAAIGVAAAVYVPDFFLAAGLAVGVSITAMYYLRCLHPPGGATALLAVIGDQQVHGLGFDYIALPVLANVAVLLAAALLVNRVLLKRAYPHTVAIPQGEAVSRGDHPPVKLGFDETDLAAALKAMDGYIDVTGEDLERIYSLAVLHSQRRRMGAVQVGDIMVREVVAVSPDQSLEEVWQTLRQTGIRGAPVVDGDGHVEGMVTISDFLRLKSWRLCDTVGAQLRARFSRQGANPVERIMTVPVALAGEEMHVTDAFLLFAEKGVNHLPVVDQAGRLVGIVTRMDLLAALYGGRTAPAAA